MDLPATYVAATESLLTMLSLSHELGHLGGGLIVYLGVLGFLASRRARWLPLATVILAEFCNEAMQAAYYGSWRTADTLADICWTVGLPLLLFLLAGERGRARMRTAIRSGTGRATYAG